MAHPIFEKFGSVGAVLAALACPICFPKIALVGAILGLSAFAPYEGYIAVAVQALFLIAFVGQCLAFRRHRNPWLPSLSAIVTLLLFVGYYVFPSSVLLQVALLGLTAASVWLVLELRRCTKCATEARLKDGGIESSRAHPSTRTPVALVDHLNISDGSKDASASNRATGREGRQSDQGGRL